MDGDARITDSFPRRRRARARTESKGRSGARRGHGADGRGRGNGTAPPADPRPAPEDARDPPDAPRRAPRHLLDMLRSFDLAWEYGPCSGITRLQRWERARALGLCPPDAVREALLEHGDDPAVTYSLWHEYGL